MHLDSVCVEVRTYPDCSTRVQVFLRISVIVSDLFVYLPGNLSQRADLSWRLKAIFRFRIPSPDVTLRPACRALEHSSPNPSLTREPSFE